jgi:hypothetical protein
MRPVGGVRGTSAIQSGTARPAEVLPSSEPNTPANSAPANGTPGEPVPDTGRALIALADAPPDRNTPAATQRSSAGFLTHLIATAGQLPQTRERRRAEPQDAISAYASTARADASLPQKFSRSS